MQFSKWEKALNRHVTQEDIQIENDHMKRCFIHINSYQGDAN